MNVDQVQVVTPGRRTGATWVAATGAFLLLAAATVFVATRWDQIPEAVKLAVLVGFTGAAVLTGDRIRDKLPATGNALFHLGALLIPVDGIALGLRMHLEWEQLVLMTGVIATGALTLLAVRSKSPVLAAAASGGVVLTAAGIGAVSAVPAALALAVIAAIATWYKPIERHAWAWAMIAGVAPVLALAPDGVYGNGVARIIGVLAVTPWYASLAAGVISALVIARGAQLRNEPALAIIGLVALVAHGIAAWDAAAVSHVVEVLALPSLFVLIEVGVLLARRDAFWGGPSRVVGLVTEIVAAVPTFVAIPAGLIFLSFERDPVSLTAIACAVTGLAWLVAAVRREAYGEAAIFAAAAWGLTAVAVATAEPAAVAATALAAALASMLVLRQRSIGVVCGLSMYATLAGASDSAVALAAGVASALVIAAYLVLYRERSTDRSVALVVAMSALALGEVAGADAAGHVASALIWVVGCWLIAIAADTDGDRNGDAARVVAFLALIPMFEWPAAEMLPIAIALTAFAAIEGVLTRRLVLANGAVIPLVVAQMAAADVAGLDIGPGGLALCVAATVWLGLAALAPERWQQPLTLAALASGTVGVIAAAASVTTLGPAVFVVGMLTLGAGFMLVKPELVHGGALVATIGSWITFAAYDVVATEAYALPVVLYLLAAGFDARRRGKSVNSWVAYGPAIALLTGAALAERIGGGDAWHSVFAGAVGVAAVVAGGSRRLAAPLLLGTGALVAVVARESFDTAAGIPTWAWLAAGGATLIGSAVLMERNDLGPIEAGRRVVDVVAAHFE